jgi:hypothetical protein
VWVSMISRGRREIHVCLLWMLVTVLPYSSMLMWIHVGHDKMIDVE